MFAKISLKMTESIQKQLQADLKSKTKTIVNLSQVRLSDKIEPTINGKQVIEFSNKAMISYWFNFILSNGMKTEGRENNIVYTTHMIPQDAYKNIMLIYNNGGSI